MPSPVGHILAGTAVYLAGTKREGRSRVVLALVLLGSIAPDFDFLPGILIGDMRTFHHGISHSFALALFFAALSYAVALFLNGAVAGRAALLGMLAYTSHVILDFISVNEGTRGVPLLWPLSDEQLGFSLHLFGHFRYGDISEGIWSVVRLTNIAPLFRELSILSVVVIVLLRKEQLWRSLVSLLARRTNQVNPSDESPGLHDDRADDLVPGAFVRSAAVMRPFLAWASCVAMLTLFPFDFVLPANDQRITTILFEQGLARRGPDVVLNTLLFLPLGAWLHREGQRRSVGLPTVLLLTAIAGALISFTVECLQLLLPSRFPSVLDVVSNTSGAVLGVYFHNLWAVRLTAATARLRGRASPAMVAGFMAGFAVVALLVSAALQARTRLSNWNEDYPLLVGNEATGDRSWRGRVFAVELTDAATPPASLRLFADGGSPILAGVSIAAFDFSGSAPYRDSTDHVPDFNWTSAPHEPRTRGAAVSERAWLRTDGAAVRIVRRLRESNAFTLHVTCASDGKTTERGRILSNSLNTGERNFSLEQRGESMVFRLRTPVMGDNASHPEIAIDKVFSDDGPRHILVTYNGAALQAAVANSGVVHRFELDPGSALAATWDSYLPASQLQTHKLIYIAGLFLPAGLLVVLFGRTVSSQFAWSVLWTLGFTVLLEATLVSVSGRSFEWLNLVTTAAVGALVLMATALVLSGLLDECRPHASA